FSQVFSALIKKNTLSLKTTTLSKLQQWLKDLATTKGRREILSSASDADFLDAHAKWLILRKVTQYIPGVDRLVDGVGLNQAKLIAIGFGGMLIRILLYIQRSTYADRVTKIVELGEDLIKSAELDIRKAPEQQFFHWDDPFIAAK